MALREEFEKSGNWLFRWRSYLPLLMLGIILIGLKSSKFLQADSHYEVVWELICLAVSFIGLGIRIFTIGQVPKGTSGRNVAEQKADVLNTGGIYSIVRHPLYVGNSFIWLGLSLFVQVWWVSLLCVLVFWLYYERIMFAEEEFLRKKFGDDYLTWAEKTPAFIPDFRRWQSAELAFSFRTVLKREYSGLLAIVASFAFLDVVSNLLHERRFDLDLHWRILLGFAIVLYLILRTLNRKTKILHVEGR